jgi:murein DD-endopeptidase MepM/ murein hydrolase activator NlpD
MTSLFGVHWIPEHRGPEDKARFAAWQPPFVKIVCVDERPPYTEDVPASAQIIIRNYQLSENNGNRNLRACDPVNLGRVHALTCRVMADYCGSKGIADGRLLFEGLNEPQVWADEPPELVAAYYKAFLGQLHAYGLHGVVLNFGVGWPGNGGITDAAPIWAPYEPVRLAMREGDYLGLHEYWDMQGPGENWRWWAGRYEQCPWPVPIIITECGVDRGVSGAQGGWIDLPGNTVDAKATRYVQDLADYEARLRRDGRVRGALIFTYDQSGADWQRFSIRNDVLMPKFLAYVQAQPNPLPAPVTPPAPAPLPEPAPEPAVLPAPRLLAPVVAPITQEFGEDKANYAAFGLIHHNGRDYGAPAGTAVKAAHGGQCWVYNDPGGYGQTVEIWYPSISAKALYKTIYAHLSAFSVSDHQMIEPGAVVGQVGSTGNSTGPHLHFGVKFLAGRNPGYRDWVDPRPFLAG